MMLERGNDRDAQAAEHLGSSSCRDDTQSRTADALDAVDDGRPS